MRVLTFAVVIVGIGCVGWLAARPWPENRSSAGAASFYLPKTVSQSEVCLAIGANGGFDWRQIRTDPDLERCLEHIAQSLATPEAMAGWLSAQGFTVLPPYEGVPPVALMLSATWSSPNTAAQRPYGGAWSRLGDRVSALFRKLPGLDFVLRPREYRVTLSYDASGNVSADAGTLYL